MKEITPEELLGQLAEIVSLLAAPATAQCAWLSAHQYPVDELALQFDDAVPMWFARLGEARLIEPETELALLALQAALTQMSGASNSTLWTGQALSEREEWQRIRAIAGSVLPRLAAP